MRQSSEQGLCAGLNNVKNGKSLNLASRERVIPYSTLQNRNQGQESYTLAAENQ
jgi:hypothetical protein